MLFHWCVQVPLIHVQMQRKTLRRVFNPCPQRLKEGDGGHHKKAGSSCALNSSTGSFFGTSEYLYYVKVIQHLTWSPATALRGDCHTTHTPSLRLERQPLALLGTFVSSGHRTQCDDFLLTVGQHQKHPAPYKQQFPVWNLCTAHFLCLDAYEYNNNSNSGHVGRVKKKDAASVLCHC